MATYRKMLNQLIAMHTSMRPHGTRTERRWAKHWIGSLPGAYLDTYGNWHVAVDDSPILWSCHTDTVHRQQGSQRVSFDQKTGELTLSLRESVANCLGADDTTGVWLMRQLVLRRVPGHYIFHYGEESGGIGSTKIARHHATWLQSFKCAIALDRRGYTDVITHQASGRTASDDFAKSLAKVIGGSYESDSTGIYTDTAEYADDIPECTNLAIGCFHSHSKSESQDCYHALWLLEQLTKVRVSDLVIARTAGDWDRASSIGRWDYSGQWSYAEWSDTDCDSAALKYGSGQAGSADDSKVTYRRCELCDILWDSSYVSCPECGLQLRPKSHADGWECDYCWEWNDPREVTCDWCGKPSDLHAAKVRPMYLTPEASAVNAALTRAQHDLTKRLGPAITSPACSCTPNKDRRGVIQHEITCAVTRSCIGGK